MRALRGDASPTAPCTLRACASLRLIDDSVSLPYVEEVDPRPTTPLSLVELPRATAPGTLGDEPSLPGSSEDEADGVDDLRGVAALAGVSTFLRREFDR